MPDDFVVKRNLAMDAVGVTEAAACAAISFLGRGDEMAADMAAVAAMHESLSKLPIDGIIKIGESAESKDAKLMVGAKAGSGDGPRLDVALMPLEGPTIVAKGEHNGLSVIAMTDAGGFLHVPDVYMDKIAVGGGLPDGVVDIDATPEKNLQQLAKAKGVDVGDLVVCVLDRPRHAKLIAAIRQAGSRIILIADGDVSGVIATTWMGSGIDMYMGTGGAPQGVLAAAALNCVGGQMQGRLVIRDDNERKSAIDCGIDDLQRKYDVNDMASGNITMSATGVTDGDILAGVRKRHGHTVTQSLVISSTTGTFRFVEAHHKYSRGR